MYEVIACKRLREELEILYILQESKRIIILYITNLIKKRKEHFIRVKMYNNSTRNLTKVETYNSFYVLQESRRKITLQSSTRVENIITLYKIKIDKESFNAKTSHIS